jgi:hypothetical protein
MRLSLYLSKSLFETFSMDYEKPFLACLFRHVLRMAFKIHEKILQKSSFSNSGIVS